VAQDLPTAVDLLGVVALFLEREIVPATEGSRQFRARVAANVMRVIAREIQREESYLRGEVTALAELLGKSEPRAETVEEVRRHALALNRELCERIRAGAADHGGFRERTLDVVRAIVENKLEVANPAYLEADRKLRTNESR
jgi:Domain of unknown function (DUF6285)